MNLGNSMLGERSQGKRLHILYVFYMKCQKKTGKSREIN